MRRGTIYRRNYQPGESAVYLSATALKPQPGERPGIPVTRVPDGASSGWIQDAVKMFSARAKCASVKTAKSRRQKILELLAMSPSGLSIDQIAAEMDCSRQTVRDDFSIMKSGIRRERRGHRHIYFVVEDQP